MKRIAVLLPALAETSMQHPIAQSLKFLEPFGYVCDLVDPLNPLDESPDKAFYANWSDRLQAMIETHVAFMGLSLGGVILQSCISSFKQSNRPLFLFSAPTKCDKALQQALAKVIALLKSDDSDKALEIRQKWLKPSASTRHSKHLLKDKAFASKRLISGYSRVRNTDTEKEVQGSNVPSYHFVGEHSPLVKREHVFATSCGEVLTVPGAYMRVLEDNPSFCQKALLERLP